MYKVARRHRTCLVNFSVKRIFDPPVDQFSGPPVRRIIDPPIRRSFRPPTSFGPAKSVGPPQFLGPDPVRRIIAIHQSDSLKWGDHQSDGSSAINQSDGPWDPQSQSLQDHQCPLDQHQSDGSTGIHKSDICWTPTVPRKTDHQVSRSQTIQSGGPSDRRIIRYPKVRRSLGVRRALGSTVKQSFGFLRSFGFPQSSMPPVRSFGLQVRRPTKNFVPLPSIG